jgi:sugar phosphate permease
LPTQFFYGWVIAIAAGLGLACGIATFVAATFPIFIGPIAREFGWSQGVAFNAPVVITVTTLLIAPWTGALVDRWGARRVIAIAFMFEALIVASFYWQGANPLSFYVRYCLLGALALGTTHVAFARLISLWFDRRRGLALGVALTGVGVGGAILPILSQTLIGSLGWRMAYLWLAAGLLLVISPLLLWLIRDTPSALGLSVDGNASDATGSAALAKSGFTLEVARRTGFFWLMLAAVLLMGIGIQSVMLHMKPLLETRGMSDMGSTYAQSAVFVGLIGGRLLAGWLMDRYFAPRVAIGFLLAALAGILLLTAGVSGVLAYLAALLVGLASGGEVDVIAYRNGRYFGLQQFSRIYAIFYATYSLGGGIGPRITAAIVDTTGSYAPALVLDFVLLLAAGLLLWFFPPFAKFSNPPDL